MVKLVVPSTAVDVFDSYQIAVPLTQLADSKAVEPLQIVTPLAVGSVGFALTVTVCAVLALTQFGTVGVPIPPLSQATK